MNVLYGCLRLSWRTFRIGAGDAGVLLVAQLDEALQGLQRDLDNVQDGLPAFAIEDGMAQRDGENLIGPTGIVMAFLAIDHVEEVAVGAPELLVEGT